MKRKILIPITLFAFCFFVTAQETKHTKGHYNLSKFKQLKELLPTPNKQHNASGAPGYEYTQQKVDYKIDITLDEENNKILGKETITYHNNSKDHLEYLWVQLDQNLRSANSNSKKIRSESLAPMYSAKTFAKKYIEKPFDGGFKIEYVTDEKNNALDYTINFTMMRVILPKPLAPNEKFIFNIKWWYNINNYLEVGGRSGYEHFKDGNNLYVIAQFFPRLAVYNNVEGWQNLQFWGRSEFALEFGDYEVSITTPADHILQGTGTLQNPKEVFTNQQYKRYIKSQKEFNKPVFIVTPEEALKAEKSKSSKTKTWKLYAKDVRDFAFATSRKFIWDAMAVKFPTKTTMAYSLYPNEGNPLWQEHATKVVANTLKVYSERTFDYPYPHATAINAANQGMEYPMICWNYGRPENGKYTNRTKRGMIGVITHEIGHNFFPMIVNSDERQWTWMDEGLNTFIQQYAQHKYAPELFSIQKFPKRIIGYMKGDQSKIAPIMTQGDFVHQFRYNAYTKPAVGLFILREVIMGKELFDYAFKTYANRWKFKHPIPADFFRTIEDASAFDLDWFWRGWFYTTWYNDMSIKEVKKFTLTNKPTKKGIKMAEKYNIEEEKHKDYLYFSEEINTTEKTNTKNYNILKKYIAENYPKNKNLNSIPKYFYKVTFKQLGELVMPILIEITFKDGSKERRKYPAKVWRRNDKEITKVIAATKEIKSIVIDPDEQTADVNPTNNSWPLKQKSRFSKFKSKNKQ